MIGHHLGGAGGIVRHIADGDGLIVEEVDALHGSGDRFRTVVDNAVEVEQHTVDRCARFLRRTSIDWCCCIGDWRH